MGDLRQHCVLSIEAVLPKREVANVALDGADAAGDVIQAPFDGGDHFALVELCDRGGEIGQAAPEVAQYALVTQPLIEPLRELFKDEVRELGRELELPDFIIDRQPFPGPGLAVRMIGEVTPERVELLQQADLRVQDEVLKMSNYRDIWQSFAVLLPIQTVGVMGDERTYENVVAVRAVQSLDGMTADWFRLPYETLDSIARRIINEVRGVNRVVFDISSKPPSTIEWE